MASDPNIPPSEPVPPLGPEPGSPAPAVPPVEDDRPSEPPIQLPGHPGLPERVAA